MRLNKPVNITFQFFLFNFFVCFSFLFFFINFIIFFTQKEIFVLFIFVTIFIVDHTPKIEEIKTAEPIVTEPRSEPAGKLYKFLNSAFLTKVVVFSNVLSDFWCVLNSFSQTVLNWKYKLFKVFFLTYFYDLLLLLLFLLELCMICIFV